MRQISGVCDKCGSEIFMNFCNCSALTSRDKQIDRHQEALAEAIEKPPRRKDPQWKIKRRRSPRR